MSVKMKLLFLIFLASFRYVQSSIIVEAPDRPSFKFYWNTPTFQCASKKIPFTHIYKDFGILQNQNDRFNGEKINLLYHPGKFPRMDGDKPEHGGVPQRGDLAAHLEQFRSDLQEKIPDETFDGLGIIDMERWRPVYDQNYGGYLSVKTASYHLEKNVSMREWKESWLQAEAKRNFELSAREFMAQSLIAAREIRPMAQWGYYAYPYCFNMESGGTQEECSVKTKGQNDDTYWLWAESEALYPSLYSRSELNTTQLASLIKGRVAESKRVAAKGSTPVFPYFKFTYSNTGDFFTKDDLNTALDTLHKSGASGVIIWGASSHTNTPQKCKDLLKYVNEVFGPAVAKYTKPKVETATQNPVIPAHTENKTITEQTQTSTLVDIILRNVANATSTLNSNVYSNEDITIVVIHKSPHTALASPSNNTLKCSDSSPININFNEIHIHNSNNMDVLNSKNDLAVVNSNGNGVNKTDHISGEVVGNNTGEQNEVVTEVSIDKHNTTQVVRNVTDTLNSSNADSKVKEVSNNTNVESTITGKMKSNYNIEVSLNNDNNYTNINHTEINDTQENYTVENHTKGYDKNDEAGNYTEVNYAEANITTGNYTERNSIEDKYTVENYTKGYERNDDAVNYTEVNYAKANITTGNYTERNSIEDKYTVENYTKGYDRNDEAGTYTEGNYAEANFTTGNYTEIKSIEDKYTVENYTKGYDINDEAGNYTEGIYTEGNHTEESTTVEEDRAATGLGLRVQNQLELSTPSLPPYKNQFLEPHNRTKEP